MAGLSSVAQVAEASAPETQSSTRVNIALTNCTHISSMEHSCPCFIKGKLLDWQFEEKRKSACLTFMRKNTFEVKKKNYQRIIILAFTFHFESMHSISNFNSNKHKT